ncbi:shikimate kinase [Simiduia agarivorans]|uniref:Shikimate kinase n=1 Tax=Simiduia agarivorans (strain DSM 21679 / JCM 13881 / BCRC 17597 / SA1) TaxID=1117647 RepID=K4KLN3_SIMAS|nr:shikimate kinase [Simiduia agarivorans]AFV00085.1 shikimate kinase [Simiduia agarivorans SA1 = DSM 21679]
MSRPVFLVGPMGAGKTTIGKLLAQQLGYPFKDTDREIEDRTGADIPWIFDVEGEAGFRDREVAILADIATQGQQVIATGGGIIMREENRECLKVSGIVFFLTASIEQLLERTAKDKRRPLLQVADPEARIRELIALREPLYREVATHVIDTNRRPPRQVAQEMAELVRNS